MLQWYVENKNLFESEIASMNMHWPDAQYGFLDDGRMYWKVQIRPIISGKRKEWIVLAVYCTNYPGEDSFRFYPVHPNYNEMTKMVQLSDVVPKYVPHMFRDSKQNMCFDIAIPNANLSNNIVESIVPSINRVARWIYLFETGMEVPEVWELFCGINRGDNCV